MKSCFFPLAALALLASCTNEEFIQQNDPITHVTVTASDYEMDAETRTNLELSSSGLTFTWAESDVIGIYPDEGTQVSFPMENGAGAKTANFDGGGWSLRGSHTYAAYFPYNVENTYFNRPFTELPLIYTGQTQPENNSTADMGAFDYMVATASTAESGSVTFNFKHVNSVLYIQLTTSEAATFTQLTLSADEGLFTTLATVDITDATLTSVGISTELSMALNNIAVGAGEKLYALMQIAPVNANGKTLTATLTASDGKTYSVQIAGKNFLTGRAYQLTGTIASSGSGEGTSGSGDDIGWGDNCKLNGHAYVDLGLPSGLLWATMNVGASAPEEYGGYYAWGETWTKSEYTWANYRWCNGTKNSVTKYNYDHAFGRVDNKERLDLADDAAHVNWGEGWYIPTADDCGELINNCTWTWTTVNGVAGSCVVGPNGNSIFLPAAGDQKDDGFQRGVGFYWSSTLYGISAWGGQNGLSSWYLHFDDSPYQDMYEQTRYCGLSIRPVCQFNLSNDGATPYRFSVNTGEDVNAGSALSASRSLR